MMQLLDMMGLEAHSFGDEFMILTATVDMNWEHGTSSLIIGAL